MAQLEGHAGALQRWSDKTLQDIVYKLVPGLFKDEMKRRRDSQRLQRGSRGSVRAGQGEPDGRRDRQPVHRVL
ncbi:polycomb group ring finger 2 [Columba livia]|uniref:Polycomb group ring finger 2 n=1 Tax=Columba livia TaxID=8932 RepID=A0A2I0LN62_COLLI|nr:polycomb group ring finger 2 [Columba livia]